MVRIATVKSLLPNSRAIIEVLRPDACSSDCGECRICMRENETVTAIAENYAGALPGDRVAVETSSGKLIKYAALFYLFPLFFSLLLFFLIPFGEIGKIAFSAAGFFASLFVARLLLSRLTDKDGIVLSIKEVLR